MTRNGLMVEYALAFALAAASLAWLAAPLVAYPILLAGVAGVYALLAAHPVSGFAVVRAALPVLFGVVFVAL